MCKSKYSINLLLFMFNYGSLLYQNSVITPSSPFVFDDSIYGILQAMLYFGNTPIYTAWHLGPLIIIFRYIKKGHNRWIGLRLP